MSMIGNFRAVSPRLLEALRQNPDLIYEVLGIPSGLSDDQFDLSLLPLPRAARKSLEAMNDEQRNQMLKELNESVQGSPYMAKMMERLRLFVEEPGGDENPGISQKLREAGFSNEDVCEFLDIQKAWHGLHFLLCGHADSESTPCGQSIMGGREIGGDIGYGPARFLEPDEVKEISAVLASIGSDDLRANFDPEKMSQAIYPGGWDEDRKDNLHWLLDAYDEVKEYYELAAEKGFAMLLYVT